VHGDGQGSAAGGGGETIMDRGEIVEGLQWLEATGLLEQTASLMGREIGKAAGKEMRESSELADAGEGLRSAAAILYGYASAINPRNQKNTQEWHDGLRERIEMAKRACEVYDAAKKGG